MDRNYQNRINPALSQDAISRAQQEYLSKVYGWMFGGLLITAFTSWFAYSNNWDLMIAGTSLIWILIIAQFGLVIGLSGWISKMSKPVAMGSFLLYSALTGLTFSVLLRAYTLESIYTTFAVTAGMFAALSFFGYVTKKDLSGLGTFMFMGLIGIIIATVLNFIIGSSALNFVISVIGVVVFSGLTAYDTQRIKEEYVILTQGDEIATKGAIIGALRLYLDFINLFLFLLRFLGGSRD